MRGAASQGTAVRFFDRSRTDGSKVGFAVEAIGEGLHAVFDTVTVSHWDRVGDPGDFLDGLARAFRRWAGERAWLNNLTVTATFGSGGHVRLSWAPRRGPFPGDWRCSVVTTFDAGGG